MVLASVPAGRADQTALVFAVAQGDAVFVHVHGRRIAFRVGLDLGGNLLPRLAVIAAHVHVDRGGRMAIFHKRDDVAIGFVYGDAARLEAGLGDNNFWSPRLAAILAALGSHMAGAPGGDDRAFHGNHNVAEPFALEDLLQVHVWVFQMRLQWTFHFSGRGNALAPHHHGSHQHEK